MKDDLENMLTFLRHKLGVLAQRCLEVVRSYSEIEKTVVTYILLEYGKQNPTEVIELCGRLFEAGFEHVIFDMPNVYEVEP